MANVIDAHALLVFLERENGHEKIEQYFTEAAGNDAYLLMSAVNFGEVYYIVLRECGAQKAREIEEIIKGLPIKIVDADVEVARQAACFKAHHKLSYADCFAAALAKRHKGAVITGDREFAALEHEIKISWIP